MNFTAHPHTFVDGPLKKRAAFLEQKIFEIIENELTDNEWLQLIAQISNSVWDDRFFCLGVTNPEIYEKIVQERLGVVREFLKDFEATSGKRRGQLRHAFLAGFALGEFDKRKKSRSSASKPRGAKKGSLRELLNRERPNWIKETDGCLARWLLNSHANSFLETTLSELKNRISKIRRVKQKASR